MRRFFMLLALLIGTATPVYADAPLLVLTVQQDKELGSLHIASMIEWNRNDLNEKKREELEKKDIFFGKLEGNKVVRQYKIRDKNIKVEMVFPKKEKGRRLNESTRVHLSLFDGDRLFFQSRNFGQHSEEYTTKPELGVKFRPQSLYLFNIGNVKLKLSGVYGRTNYVDGIGIEKGMVFTRPIKSKINDDIMNDLATKLAGSSPHKLDISNGK